MRTEWTGDYLDGRAAERQAAAIRLMPDGLFLTTQRGFTHRWAYGELRQTQGFYPGEQVRLEPRRGAGALVVRDTAFLTALRQVGGSRARHFHDPARRRLRRPAAALAALTVLALTAAAYIWAIPAAATAVAPYVPISWEERLGEAVVDYVVSPEGRCEDVARTRTLDAVVATLAATVPHAPYRFRVVVADYPAVNAFAAPGGYIVVFRGLLERTRSAEELAGVLAHELQHVIRRHVARTVVQHASTGLLLGALTGDATGLVALEVARTLGQLQYSRQYEREADAEGLKMLVAAGIDPAGMIEFFETLSKEERGTEEFRLLTYLSTHPSSSERVTELRALAAAFPRPSGKLLAAYDWTEMQGICRVARPAASRPTAPPQGTGRVYLVPLGPVSPELMDRLVSYHRGRFGVPIETLPSVPFEPNVFDPARRQLIAEEAIALMQRENPALARDPEAILIGITTHDMLIRRYRWRFAFAYRAGYRAGVVSAARMDPVFHRRASDPELLETRLRKMLSKQIGLMHFRLPESDDAESVMFGPIWDLDDLDRMGERF